MEKMCCNELYFTTNGVLPNDCEGVLSATSRPGNPEYPDDEGFYVQTCPRKSWLQNPVYGIGFCGWGSDVVVLHQDTEPTEEQVTSAINDFLMDW